MCLIEAAERLARAVSTLSFAPPVAYVYNPLAYAASSHAAYLQRFAGTGPKRALLLGMNPGPFGMAQTGIPFGDIETVRDWLQIDVCNDPPGSVHPQRPVLGLECSRVEVSGQRLWGAIRQRFGTPERFFRHYFVANYCPLAFVEDSGRNRTPDKLPATEREPLFAVCDEHLRSVVAALQPAWVIGVGAFAEKRAAKALAGQGIGIGRITHPSPANPAANRGWAEVAARELTALLGPGAWDSDAEEGDRA